MLEVNDLETAYGDSQVLFGMSFSNNAGEVVSLMGRNALLGQPNHLPRTTGARRACVLGERVPGADGSLGPAAEPAGRRV